MMFLPIKTMPQDGRPVLLLVDYGPNEYAFEEGQNPLELREDRLGRTIGFVVEGNAEGQEIQFAGWSWEQDGFCEGYGRPIGWFPLPRPRRMRWWLRVGLVLISMYALVAFILGSTLMLTEALLWVG